MNKVILMGRLTRDPEMRQSQQGTPVVSFSLAVDRRFAKEGQQQADFINCVAWSRLAEFICKYFQKGSMIAVSGRLQSRTYDDKDGRRQYVTEVVVEDAYFTGSRTETNTQGAQSSYQQPNNFQRPAQPSAPQGTAPTFDEFEAMGFSAMDGSEDDLPF
ncbi:MAG: single-stranded DNA-binding protein [Eubacteriales bacterium]|nr:single-stranded DNA-binding protein [Eubacteriales bacterium]